MICFAHQSASANQNQGDVACVSRVLDSCSFLDMSVYFANKQTNKPKEIVSSSVPKLS